MTTATAETSLSDALRTVAINGSYNASRALSKWLRRGVRLTSDGFKSVPIGEAAATIGEPDDLIAAIDLPLAGDVTGHMLLTFPEHVALQLADMIMQVPEGTTKKLGEIEQSCLEETGNIVASTYANSLSKWLKLQIEPRPPRFAYDMVNAIVDPLLMDLAATQDEVFVASTDFLIDRNRLQWGLMLLPSSASWQLMEERCRIDTVRENALQTIAVNGAFNASRAMSKWLKRGVKISTEGFTRVPLDRVASEFDETKPVVALHMPLGEQLHGQALLAIPEAHALRLVDLLMGNEPGTSKVLGELEQSCLEETGNIISSSFVNSWSTWLGIHIEPGPPRFVFDLPLAAIDSVLSEQAMVSDEVLMARTEFIVDDEWLEWVFLLLPAPSAMRLIETTCE